MLLSFTWLSRFILHPAPLRPLPLDGQVSGPYALWMIRSPWQNMERGSRLSQIFLQFPSNGVTILLEESCNQKANIALTIPQQVTVSFLGSRAFSSLVICFSSQFTILSGLFLSCPSVVHSFSTESFQIILIWVCHLIPSVILANRVNIFDLLIT